MADNVFTYEIDDAQLSALINELDSRKIRAAYMQGLRPSAKTIERGVLAQLSARHPAAKKYSKEVRIKLWSKGGGYTVNLSQGQISFGFSKSGKLIEYSHLYILRWLSGGTEERYTKKGWRRGRITGSHFFREGVDQSINPAVDRIADDITKAFERAAAKARAAKAAPQK